MKVSVIMPTAGRRLFIPTAIGSFQAQDHLDRELIILDDCTEAPIEDVVPNDARIRYYRTRSPMLTTGDLRNAACDLAEGDVIAHMDDDDYSHPGRLSNQLALLTGANADVVGYQNMLFIDTRPGGLAWRYDADDDYILGASFMYRRKFWARHPFESRVTGEDNHFADECRDHGRLAYSSGWMWMVQRIHTSNTAPKITAGDQWSKCTDELAIAWGRAALGIT